MYIYLVMMHLFQNSMNYTSHTVNTILSATQQRNSTLITTITKIFTTNKEKYKNLPELSALYST